MKQPVDWLGMDRILFLPQRENPSGEFSLSSLLAGTFLIPLLPYGKKYSHFMLGLLVCFGQELSFPLLDSQQIPPTSPTYDLDYLYLLLLLMVKI